jgi:hypothetical protein
MSPKQALLTIYADHIGGQHSNFRKWYFAAQLELGDADGHTQNPGLQRLCSPARLTNLGALLLSSLLTFSLLLNFRLFYLDSQTIHNAAPRILRSIVEALPERRPSASSGLDHLVIVPGHAIWIGARKEDAEVEILWLLASYQKECRRPTVFRSHISRG